MNKLVAFVKKLRLGQILVTCMAGILLFVSTACSGGPVQAKTPDSDVVTGRRQRVPAGELAVPGQKNPRPEVPGGTMTSPDRGVINRFQGGPTMNEFSDVDPRASDLEKAANRKADTLIENAQRNVIDQTSNVGENTKRILGKKGENAEEIGANLKRNADNAQEKAKGTAGDLSRGTKRGTENIKDNTSDALREADRNTTRAAEDAKGTARDLSKSAQRKAEDASRYVQDKAS